MTINESKTDTEVSETHEAPIAVGIKSSTALAMQGLQKEDEKSEAALEAMRTRCKVCFREISPKNFCGGHGGGGSSDEENTEEDASQTASMSLANKPQKKIDGVLPDDESEEFKGSMGNRDSQRQQDEAKEQNFNPKLIVQLIEKALLGSNNDRKSMTLNLNLQCKPASLSPEQRSELTKFMTAILKEFNEFKKRNNLPEDCVKVNKDKQGNQLSLQIKLPSLALYDAFIKQLAIHLLPAPSPSLQAQIKSQQSNSSAPTPLPIEPKPSAKDGVQARNKASQNKEEEELKPFNPSPLSTKMRRD